MSRTSASRLPLGAALLSAVAGGLTLLLLPFAGHLLGAHPAFLPAFFSAVLLLDALSLGLLVVQFCTTGRLRLLVFAAAYGWCVVSVLPHALVFPGVLTAQGLLGAAPPSAPWLWTSWHTGFAVLLGVAALPARRLDARRPEERRSRDVVAVLLALAVTGAAVAALVTAGNHLLPAIIAVHDYSRLASTVGPSVIAVNAAAAVLVLRHALREGGLESWFAPVAVASLGDVVLTLFAQSRFTVGWYAGRGLALAAAGTVLLGLLAQLGRVQRQLEGKAQRLRELADTDELTGLANRRALLTAGHLLAETCQELWVVVLDVDHFKQINDTLGHEAGDQVLFAVAGRIRRALRSSDVAGRYGGEEFVVLLPELTGTCPHEVAERLRHAVKDKVVTTSAGSTTPTVSIGVAQVDHGLLAALAAADAALYAAKAGGRDRTVLAEAPVLPGPRQSLEPAPAG